MRFFRKKGYKEFSKAFTESKEGKRESVKDLIDGSILTREVVIRQLPYILFLVAIAVLYITNRYHAEKVVRENTVLQKEVEELRSEALSTSSELMYLSRQSQVSKLLRANGRDLEEPVEPPRKIVVNKTED